MKEPYYRYDIKVSEKELCNALKHPISKSKTIHNCKMFRKLETVEDLLYRKNPTLRRRYYKKGLYPYIPRNPVRTTIEFIALRKWIKSNVIFTKAAKNKDNRTFLDAGAGLGNIMLIADASRLSANCTGIECNKQTLRLSKEILDKKFELIPGDIITYNRYKKFDIIHYFCPISCRALEIYFEEQIEDNVPVGTIILPKLKISASLCKDPRFVGVDLNINTTYGKRLTFFIKTSMGQRKKSALSNILKHEGSLDLKNIPKKYKALIEARIKRERL